jgi:hypothetical protein
MDLLRLAGLDTVRITTIWAPGQTSVGPLETTLLRNVADAAKFDGIRLIITIMHQGSRTTPLTDEQQQQFASFSASVASKLPTVRDFIVANEPNLNRFWLPQYDPVTGADVAAPAYMTLLARTYDAIKAVRPYTTIYGGALAPRGVDKPGTGRDTHSPTTFIRDLGAAYRASGRQLPIMDALSFHPYADNSSQSPDFAHPNSTAIGIADYDKLVGLLKEAFDGTAQRGSTLPILYDEFGVESTVPAAKESLYSGTEPTTTKPVDEATQAAYYRKGLELTFCQPNVMGYLLFHVVDEAQRPAWQSGLYYVDGTPKSSLGPVRDALGESRRGIIATCSGLQLTPTAAVAYPKPAQLKKRSFKLSLTCTIDCAYTVRLERMPVGTPVLTRTGTAIGRTKTSLTFTPRRPLKPGSYRFSIQAVATVNVGPPFVTTSSPLRVR